MKHRLLILLLWFWVIQLYPQSGQISIPRIDQMPDLPQPLLIRDWKMVAHDYDSLVFNLNKTGQYLPLVRLGTPGQFNYPGNTPVFLDSYVGADSHANQAEAINIIPAIVGASLAGIDKSNQYGLNWVAMTKDFFNLKNRQNVYLNGYSATSGNDWWYDLMPNVFFYQLRSLYPGAAPEFDSQFVAVADRWLNCVTQLGGSATPWTLPNMNWRAFNLITGLPLTTGVREPESAGSIAWLLYNAYVETGDKKYLTGARLSMDFLAGFGSNPSYELQLPYGTLVAARMNAEEGTGYPLQKMLDWCFNRGDLRGWGSIVGKWGGYDVSGLIGEANDNGDDYAFIMNGFQQAAALAPLPKYDKRYARAIAKWILNVTNASRYFYRDALPQANQDSREWSELNDPAACIPHESMKQVWLGKTPFATGDAIRGGWAATNLSLYSGSSVGYLAAVVEATNVPEILQIDLNKTDFYGDNTLTTYLYYNPTGLEQQVNVDFSGEFAVYEAITETTLSAKAGSIVLTIPTSEVRLIRLYPPDQIPESRDGRLYAGDAILDYHYGYDYHAVLRIKSLAADHNPVAKNSAFNAWCEPENFNPEDTVKFTWFMNDIPVEDQSLSGARLTAPSIPSLVVLKCRITSKGQTDEDTIHIQVVDKIPQPPAVTGILCGSVTTPANGSNTFTAIVEPVEGEILEYAWSVSAGTLYQPEGKSVTWQAPSTSAVATISVQVTNQDNLSATANTGVLVKDTTLSPQDPLIWYPFDTDDRNAAADRFHATATGVAKTEDARGMASSAYRFTAGQNIIYTENSAELNFSGAVSLSCWVRCEQFGSERFILSHGSWQQRYKLSITPEGKLRWTVKTGTGISDLDGSSPIELNRYYHVTASYTGYSMEMYIDGVLDTFKSFSGAILPSTKSFTIGRMDETETLYSLRGSVDEVRLWDKEIPVRQIEQLKNQWSEIIPADTLADPISRCWPNPAHEVINLEFTGPVDIVSLSLYASDGKMVSDFKSDISSKGAVINIPPTFTGLYLLRIITKDGRTATRKMVIR